MGYAGYVPAKYAPAAPTAVQAALYAVRSLESLEMIAKLTKNVVVSPTGETICLILLRAHPSSMLHQCFCSLIPTHMLLLVLGQAFLEFKFITRLFLIFQCREYLPGG